MNPTLQTLKISILFFILFTATNSSLTILTFIYEQAQVTALAPANIAISYLTFIISTVYAPTCTWKIKNQLLIATIAYTLNFSTGLVIPHVAVVQKFIVSGVFACLAGLSAGLLWVSQGRYIHLVCEQTNSNHRKGQFFGIFSLLYCLSHISAGMITTFGLGFFSVEVYFYCLTCTGIIAILFCFFFIKNIQNTTSSEIDQSLALAPTNNPTTTQQQESLGQVFKYYPKMSSILVLLIIDGLCYGFHISQITHMIPQDTPDELMNLYAGYCNIALGCGASLGGFLSGYLGDRVSSLKTGNIGIALFLLGTVLAYLTIQIQQFALTLASSFFWGLFLFFIQGWLYIVCSRQFKGRSQSFSVNKQLGSITCFLFQIGVMFTNNNLKLQIFIPVMSVLALPAWYTLKKLPQNVRKSMRERNSRDGRGGSLLGGSSLEERIVCQQ